MNEDDLSLTKWLLIIFGGGGVLVALLLIIIPAFAKKKKRRPAPGIAVPPAIAQPVPVSPPVSPASSGLFLQELAGENPGEVWPIGTYEIKFGRKKEDNDIPLKGETASRRMALMQLTQQGLVLHPLKPENPVRVNDKPIQSQTMLKPGDEITMGESKFKIIRS